MRRTELTRTAEEIARQNLQNQSTRRTRCIHGVVRVECPHCFDIEMVYVRMDLRRKAKS